MLASREEELPPPSGRERNGEAAASFVIADEEDTRPNAATFPVVGVGASAGGLEAFTELRKRLVNRMGAALKM